MNIYIHNPGYSEKVRALKKVFFKSLIEMIRKRIKICNLITMHSIYLIEGLINNGLRQVFRLVSKISIRLRVLKVINGLMS